MKVEELVKTLSELQHQDAVIVFEDIFSSLYVFPDFTNITYGEVFVKNKHGRIAPVAGYIVRVSECEEDEEVEEE